ncbi:acetyl-CoA carboxylase biotin carboxyl carrier protein [Anabaena cylindrica FACHB-243]|uniref:Biotin carboxyl carrier protein of acetyl-CoA carboxylase n=1 Tax=Anabaena cylindrica (strain ATCC 27899 / PCC 7122) TaxID=272123 RepID=K9ZBW7_ANACC|nr:MULTISPECIES: acetyl-CoA carboxylase biotin carboxyl carrier protein [Anabaena]AFZ55875.1 biotin carboxyl carrier protein [Anabaena cylindrica PCC 7122]MBD2421297.1 acetyl-CoA carboxylase biotin carboxyl carrier protein [Anabaena cylindrica FACHB-243]MBY5280867.1 acetyl-CoA carboxylase biotin carboxyl carrier protein [Anabaena sp. CCAP 1446/1C]MBY5309992.1 acetyl-CoA carboxylase biotin carboxyl carrier protein [Anabaena sp. CCAP 1446/1C]MCM2406629.1 acetyl-CoA carboxylase biotin carboxyl ca
MPLDFNEIRQLLATIAQTDIAEVTLKSDDFELTVRKGVSNHILSVGQATLGGVVGSGLTSVNQTAPTTLPEAATSRDNSVAGVQSPLSVNTPSARLVEVQSPMVGTFYRAPAPGEAAFVEVGDRVRSGQSVCIIEAMKLMNEIEAEVSGQVMEILVQNGEAVEYGQPLMRINPD